MADKDRAPEGDSKKAVAPSVRKLSKKRLWAFRLVACTILPLLLFGVLELGLRIFGYGYPTSFFVKSETPGEVTTNLRFGHRFFPKAVAREPAIFNLSKKKPEGTYRIFVLGGSAARGTPESAYGFARFLETMLEQQLPEKKFEVVNAAMTAINSHVVLPIARDCADYDPDLFVIYVGNNEVVGPYGPGTVFSKFHQDLSVIRSGIRLKSSRTGQWIATWSPRKQNDIQEWRGMEMFLEQQVSADSPRMETVYAHFESNLTDLLAVAKASGAKTVLCTVPSNLRDSPPCASDEQTETSRQVVAGAGTLIAQGQVQEAFTAVRSALDKDPESANLNYLLARCFDLAGQADPARKHYLLARDLDTLRFRADSRINRIIHETAEARAGEALRLADFEKTCAGNSKDGIPGKDLFFEHVHLTPKGNYLMAAATFRQAVELLFAEELPSATKNFPSFKTCAAHLALTPWDLYRITADMHQLQSKAPFTNQLGHRERITERKKLLKFYKENASTPKALDAALAQYQVAMKQDPGNSDLRRGLAVLLASKGETEGAVDLWRSLVADYPHAAIWHNKLGVVLNQAGKPEEAIEAFRRAMRINPAFRSSMYFSIGQTYLKMKQYDKAIATFKTAMKKDRGTRASMLFNIGSVYMELDKLDDAETAFKQALKWEPEKLNAWNALGMVALRRKDYTEAVKRFEQVVTLDPAYAESRLNAARLYTEAKRYDDAARHYRALLAVPGEKEVTVLQEFAEVLDRLGLPDEAVKLYAATALAQPRDAEAQVQLAVQLHKGRRFEAAAQAYRMALSLDPSRTEVRIKLANVLNQVGEKQEAVLLYKDALLLDPTDVTVSFNLARILASDPNAALRDGELAVQLMEKVCRDPERRERAMYLDGLAAAYAEVGRFDKAAATVMIALEVVNKKGDTANAEHFRNRLAMYEDQKPLRLGSARP